MRVRGDNKIRTTTSRRRCRSAPSDEDTCGLLFGNDQQTRQRQKEKREAAKWLQSLIGEDWGIRVLPSGADKPRPVHANMNKRFEAVISKRAWKKAAAPLAGLDGMLDDSWEPAEGHGRPSGIWLDRLSQRRIIRHFDGVPRQFRINGETVIKPETVYFTGDGPGEPRPA